MKTNKKAVILDQFKVTEVSEVSELSWWRKWRYNRRVRKANALQQNGLELFKEL